MIRIEETRKRLEAWRAHVVSLPVAHPTWGECFAELCRAVFEHERAVKEGVV